MNSVPNTDPRANVSRLRLPNAVFVWFALAFAGVAATSPAVDFTNSLGIAQPTNYVLQGRIMDPRTTNWLAGVRVELKKAGVLTNTDSNGVFKIKFSILASPVADADGGIERLEMHRDGYYTRIIRITDIAYFTKPIEETMERNPVGKDNVGFVTLMPQGTQFIDLMTPLGTNAPHFFTADRLREVLDRAAARSRNAIPDKEAYFYAWVPKDTKQLRAAFLISLHGIGTLDHPVLRRFAEEHGVALVGVYGDPIQRGCYPIAVLDKHLERLGALVGHPELTTVPVFTFGHSNGTGFSAAYAVDRADRLICWIAYHSGYAWQLLLPGMEKAPGLVMHGHLDEYLVNGQEQAVKDLRSQRQAPVGMMLEGNVGHAPEDAAATWEFIVAFCEAAMRVRLNEDGTLRPVNIEKGWLGGIYDRRIGGQQLLPIAPMRDFTGDRSTANWLPDEEFARTWQAYGQKNPRR